MSNWILTKDVLPETGKWVFAKHNRLNWRDVFDQENVNTVVVKLVKGISVEERNSALKLDFERGYVYKSEDEHGNNKVPYNWMTFGSTSFFGQEITHWMPIPSVTE